MSRNTATGAKVKQERKITFKNKEHEIFYNTYLSKCSCQDSYHKTLIYCLDFQRTPDAMQTGSMILRLDLLNRSACRKDGRPVGVKRLSVLLLTFIQTEHLQLMNIRIQKRRLQKHGFIQ